MVDRSQIRELLNHIQWAYDGVSTLEQILSDADLDMPGVLRAASTKSQRDLERVYLDERRYAIRELRRLLESVLNLSDDVTKNLVEYNRKLAQLVGVSADELKDAFHKVKMPASHSEKVWMRSTKWFGYSLRRLISELQRAMSKPDVDTLRLNATWIG